MVDFDLKQGKRWSADSVGRGSIAVIVGLLFLCACFTPSVRTLGASYSVGFFDYTTDHIGLSAFLFGWCSAFLIPWLANLFFIPAYVLLLRRKYLWAAALATCAFFLGLTVWLFKKEGIVIPPKTALRDLYLGYYLWQASLGFLAAGSVVLQAYTLLHRRAFDAVSPQSDPQFSSHWSPTASPSDFTSRSNVEEEREKSNMQDC